MFTFIAVTPINHVLHGESWACKRLQNCAGKTVRIQIFPFVDFTFSIQTDGMISAASDNATVDTSLSLSPDLLPYFLTKDEAVLRKIKISGDDVIARELIDIGKNLHWDVEQDLSKIMGDIPAHRVIQASEKIVNWHWDSFNNLSQALIEYWTEEQPILAKTLYINNFVNEVGKLQSAAEQLEQRIQKLSNKIL
ncbi:MAG: ubiquinone biosynthesis protein [Nitrosomonas sp.]|nr:ubiquinone biosynthesis protein [Nitrosomonas sp.]MDP1949582.1 ubiquinone biosynthesis protein [Nitrosomonas sp.]